MAAPVKSNVLVGSETGLLKSVDIGKKSWSNVNHIDKPNREDEICVMCWDGEAKERAIFGLRNKKVKIYDIQNQEISDMLEVAGERKLCGLAKTSNCYITALETGLVNVWDSTNFSKQSTINAGDDLYCLQSSVKQPNLIATGGKENDLKLWDITNSTEPIFHAKNIKHDWLNLRVPIWITNIQYQDNGKIVVCTGYHQIRIYDPLSSQRRPVMEFAYGEYPFICMTLLENQNFVVVGDTVGKMALMDLRKGAMVQLYKGFSGGVTDVQFYQPMNTLVSTSLDRFVRVHDVSTKKLLHKFYLKSKLKCLLISNEEWDIESEKKKRKQEETDENDDENDNDEDNPDELWDSLKSTEKKVKHNNEPVVSEKSRKCKIKK